MPPRAVSSFILEFRAVCFALGAAALKSRQRQMKLKKPSRTRAVVHLQARKQDPVVVSSDMFMEAAIACRNSRFLAVMFSSVCYPLASADATLWT